MVDDDEVEQVYVSSRHRGKGVADVLLAEAERQVRENGHAIAWLAVVDGNARARSFYERAGWSDDGRVRLRRRGRGRVLRDRPVSPLREDLEP